MALFPSFKDRDRMIDLKESYKNKISSISEKIDRYVEFGHLKDEFILAHKQDFIGNKKDFYAQLWKKYPDYSICDEHYDLEWEWAPPGAAIVGNIEKFVKLVQLVSLRKAFEESYNQILRSLRIKSILNFVINSNILSTTYSNAIYVIFLVIHVLPKWVHQHKVNHQKSLDVLEALSALLIQSLIAVRDLFTFQRLSRFCFSLGAMGNERAWLSTLVTSLALRKFQVRRPSGVVLTI